MNLRPSSCPPLLHLRHVAALALALAAGSRGLGNEATLTLTSLSMKVPPASVNLLGSVYSLSFTTADDDSINSELFAAEGTQTYQSYATLDYPGSEALGPLIGLISVDIPLAGDTNVNGITDFLEVDRAIARTTTSGTIEIDDGMDFSQGTVSAVWTRPAGQAAGTVELRVNLPDFGFQNLTFNHTFEIFQYRGPLSYTRSGSTVSATINLARQGAAGAFTGAFPLTRISNGELNRADVVWKGPGNLDFEVLGTDALEDVPLPVSYIAGPYYGGLVIFADGDPTTPFPDEYDFFDLLIEDRNDADADGLPDLSDDLATTPTRPTLAARVVSTGLQLDITGAPGNRLVVESSPILPATDWNTVTELTLDATGKASVPAGDLTAPSRLFRTRIL